MKITISDSAFTDCKEIVIIYWREIDSLKVFVSKENVELNYPYTHKVAFSYLENLDIIIEEYPDYISFVTDKKRVKTDGLSINDKNFLAFVDNGLTKLYFSSLDYGSLSKLFPEIKRMVTKGIRIDVN